MKPQLSAGLDNLGLFDKFTTFLLIVLLPSIIQKCQLVSSEIQLALVSLVMPMDFFTSHKEIK